MRTPYGAPESTRPLAGESYRELVAEGYIFVFQDIRGRYKSEGTFVMQRPPRDRREPGAIDESDGRLRYRRVAYQERARA